MDSKNCSKYGHIINGIKVGLCTLRSWQIVHIKRDANSTAHDLAREAISSVIDRVWVEKILNYIYGIVIKEQFALV